MTQEGGLLPQWRAPLESRLLLLLSPEISTRCEASKLHLSRLWAAMRHGVLNGGKRVRGLLLMGAARATGANPLSQTSLDLACALECVHAFSLVHDDLPCMDDDALRRGQPTVHVAFDEATALLVGDALQTLGFELVTSCGAPPERCLPMVRSLAQATGATGMAGGQAVDIGVVGQTMTQAELEDMHRLKTGALIRAAVQIGALAGPHGPDSQAFGALTRFAELLGLAFQVVDDILDAQSDTQTLGKTAGKDRESGKPTFISLLGPVASRDYAAQLHVQALAALETFGAEADPLREIAHALTRRAH